MMDKSIRTTGECEVNNEAIQITGFFKDGYIQELVLPLKAAGKHFFEGELLSRNEFPVYFELVGNQWMCVCAKPAVIIVNGKYCQSMPIRDLQSIRIQVLEQDCKLFVEFTRESRRVFHNYCLNLNESISIGRNSDNDIICSSGFVSGNHAVLKIVNNNFWITDGNGKRYSSNGVYVNGRRIQHEERLTVGDVINIIGMRIIVGIGFIALNDLNSKVRINKNKLKLLSETDVLNKDAVENNRTRESSLFNRLPRRRLPFIPKDIEVESPPMSMNGDTMPMMLRMGGSLVNGGMSALAGSYTMLLSSVLFPFLSKKYTDKEKKEYEEKRIKKYGEYLGEKREEIRKEKERQEMILVDNYPAVEKILSYPERKKQLWERRNKDDDFLVLRLGYGNIPLSSKISYQQQRFNMDEDELEKQMFELTEKPVYLERVPILTSLTENFVLGILGENEIVKDYLKGLICQLTILHSYDELKIVFLAQKEDLGAFSFVKYLPHAWNDQKDFRFVGTETRDAFQIGEYLKNEIEDDISKADGLEKILQKRAYYVIIALDRRMLENIEILKDVMQCRESCGVSVIAAFADLPKDCKQIVKLDSSDENELIYIEQIDKEKQIFKTDAVDSMLVNRSMDIISNTDLKTITQAYSLPKMMTFLEMFGVGRIEDLNPAKRWKESNPIKSLAASIGVNTDGTLFELDLHEKYHGPHGLVAGMTGSGKSEFLITYILSMAINYDPNEVAFVLIDYKGGGLTGAFDDKERGIHLPHLVGTITNLDGTTIQRSIASIESELKRRQKIFNKAKSISDEGTMDIYTYQKLFRSGVINEPLPHLIIISDEFAELKQQQPEFLEQLISIARIGRSLGVHLILATQKPSGIVTDQMRSNMKFKVCLKVQDKSDSTDMLKRPEAADIKETGRFYLQIGYNEYFALGQSAYCGADYEPQDQVVVQKDDSVQFIDSVGMSIIETKPRKRSVPSDTTQLVAIVKYLTKIAEDKGIVAKQLWKPELPDRVDLEEMESQYEAFLRDNKWHVLLGLADDPNNQEQYPVYYDILHGKNLVITGGIGTGKTSLLHCILYSLIKRHSPEELNIYALDYSSRMLKIFKQAPHCGEIHTEDDELRLDTFFDLIGKIVQERKALFSRLAVENYEMALTVTKLPLVLVIIDNYSGMTSMKAGESQGYKLHGYMREGLQYGVRYIITESHHSALSSRVLKEAGDRICFALQSKYEYGEVLKCDVQFTPKKSIGRGMVNENEVPLETQFCLYAANEDVKKRWDLLRDAVKKIAQNYEGCRRAKRLPVLSKTATYEEFSAQFDKGRIPLGLSLKDSKVVAFPLKQFSMFSIYVGNEDGRIPIMENFLMAAKNEQMNIVIFKRKENSLYDINSISSDLYKKSKLVECKEDSVKIAVQSLVEEVKTRAEILVEYCNDHNMDPKKERAFSYMYGKTVPIMVIIEDFKDLCDTVDTITNILMNEIIFSKAEKVNIYILAFSYPDDHELDDINSNCSGFNQDNVLLLGGRYDKQNMCTEFMGDITYQEKQQYNVGLMKYRNNYHALWMPCGEMKKQDMVEDDRNIFGEE